MTTTILTILMIISTISYGNADTPYKMFDNPIWLFDNPDDYSYSQFWQSLMTILNEYSNNP